MRKIIYGSMLSLDGYIEDPKGQIDWVLIDEEVHRFVNQKELGIGVFLYGRRMYEIMNAFWPTADADLSQPEYILDYARYWKSVPKIVFSRTLERVEGNARLVRGDAVEEIAKLREQPGKDLGIGGADLARTLMQQGWIDEYELYVNPVILGGGKRLFSEQNRSALRLIETKTFDSGVVYLHYQVEKENR